jgi:hypothetical protein
VNLFHLGFLRQICEKQTRLPGQDDGGFQIRQVGEEAGGRCPGIGNEGSAAADEVPQLGGDQYGNVELDPKNVELNINLFMIGHRHALIDQIGEFFALRIGHRRTRNRSRHE